MKLARNAKTLLTNPAIARDYLYYWGSKIKNSGQAVRAFPDGIKISDLNSFSEYHSIGDFVSVEEHEFLSKHPIGPGAVIDVGANLGIVSFILAKRFPLRTIHAFEPAPSTFRSFKANMELNNCLGICASQYAVADHEGEVPFNANPLGRAINSIALSSTNHTIQVPCTTLDAYARRNSITEIAFLKVDVEGFEASVFQGAQTILSQQRAAIVYYEVCPANSRNSGLDPAMPTRILLENGYLVHRVAAQGLLEPVRLSDVAHTVLDNWVALRP